MPIPPFDGILNILPPHLGNPAQPSDLSPYGCRVAELCDRFATSDARKQILDGFLRLRVELCSLGIEGFQWLAGSFLEDIEAQEGRDPRDIDVVTFVGNPSLPPSLWAAIGPRQDLWDNSSSKAAYHVDHFVIPLGSPPAVIVDLSRYWYGLFAHRRDRTWKGMLVAALGDKTDDDAARVLLAGKP